MQIGRNWVKTLEEYNALINRLLVLFDLKNIHHISQLLILMDIVILVGVQPQ